jgi:molybdopterin converting factor small subunit
MNGRDSQDGPEGGQVTLRYWASARSAAGVTEEQIAVTGPVSLAALVDLATGSRPGRERLAALLPTCSVLLGDRPVASADPTAVEVLPGQVVEFLPPFAGG